MNTKKKKTLLGAFVALTMLATGVLMTLPVISYLFPSMNVGQTTEGGPVVKAHQRLLLSDETVEYGLFSEEKYKVIKLWMTVELDLKELTMKMLEIMVSLNLNENNADLMNELRKAGLTTREARRIVDHLASCVPICYRWDARPETFEGDRSRYTYGEIESRLFGTTMIAMKPKDGWDRCEVSTLKNWDRCVMASENLQNEGMQVHKDMGTATNYILALGNTLGAQSSMLVIGHGIGSLPFVLQKSFPEVRIDSVDIDETVFEIAEKWFCYHKKMDESKVKKITYDGIEYMKELLRGEREDMYDVIYIDAEDDCELLPFFQGEGFFKLVDELWELWNEEKPRTRMLVINAFISGGPEIIDTPTYQNAVRVFDEDAVTVHSELVFSDILSVRMVAPGCKVPSDALLADLINFH